MFRVHRNSITLIRLLAAALIAKITIGVVLEYTDYFPANFRDDFLQGRAEYFFGAYSVAFYTHIVSGPLTLLSGLLLMSQRFLRRFPKWHRSLGKLQVICVLTTNISGLWMARYAMSGAMAGSGFALLSVVTTVTVLKGWQTAVRRQFVEHRVWMTRCFLLLCSAVVLRLTAGLATVTEFYADWVYPLSAWTSWLVPLALYEFARTRIRKGRSRAPTTPVRRIEHAAAS